MACEPQGPIATPNSVRIFSRTMGANLLTRLLNAIALACVIGISKQGCRSAKSEFELVASDRAISGKSKYPTALDSQRVRTYSGLTKSGAAFKTTSLNTAFGYTQSAKPFDSTAIEDFLKHPRTLKKRSRLGR